MAKPSRLFRLLKLETKHNQLKVNFKNLKFKIKNAVRNKLTTKEGVVPVKKILIWVLSICLFMLLLMPNQSMAITVAAERYEVYYPQIKNKRLGLIVNQTSRVKDQHLVDFLLEKQHQITLVFAPEHGFRGKLGAGEKVTDQRDPKTNLPIVSLYGKNKMPTTEQLKDVDMMIFDIQDVGVRYYTYISTMHYVMQACADNQIPLLILDRPNPNGDYIDGPVLDLAFQSFVGMHPIPLVHGLTVAELAQMINQEGWLKEGKQCQLSVVKVKDYSHAHSYSLPVKPSPNLPNDLSIRLYPSLGFFEATKVSVGRGTDFPFQVLGYPNDKMGEFEFKARKITGSWSELNHAGATLYGEKFTQTSNEGVSLGYFLNWRDKFEQQKLDYISRPSFLDKLAGQAAFRQQVENGWDAKRIKNAWKADLRAFQALRSRYLLYPDHPNVLRYSQ